MGVRGSERRRGGGRVNRKKGRRICRGRRDGGEGVPEKVNDRTGRGNEVILTGAIAECGGARGKLMVREAVNHIIKTAWRSGGGECARKRTKIGPTSAAERAAARSVGRLKRNKGKR